VKRVDWPRRHNELVQTAGWLRPALRDLGFKLIGLDEETSPAVTTIALPPEMDSIKVGDHLHQAGFAISYNSEYLRRRNWMQICLMGEHSREKLVSLLNHLNRICFRRPQTVSAPPRAASAKTPKK
jgi:aspartate aminotransferase-like enzyme